MTSLPTTWYLQPIACKSLLIQGRFGMEEDEQDC